MEDKKKNKLYALAATIALHAAVLLILLFCTLAAPLIPDNDGSGVVLQLGMIDADAGTFTPATPPPPPAVTPPEPEPVVTQDMEETVSIDEETPRKEQPKDSVVSREPEPETSHLDALWANALNKGQTAADTAAVAGEQKGSPAGTAPKGAATGSPGYGEYDLGGRGLKGALPKPDYSGTNDEGTIVISILVDASGKVVQAVFTPSGSKGSAASNAVLRGKAEEAARKAVFERKPSGNENQWGSITYYFRQN